jgi:hypothetical protein
MSENWIRTRLRDEFVEAARVQVNASNEVFNTYTLEDGTTLRVKLTVIDVMRVKDRFDKEGNPVYIVRSHTLLAVEAPERLRRLEDNP